MNFSLAGKIERRNRALGKKQKWANENKLVVIHLQNQKHAIAIPSSRGRRSG
jgi:hypothetical protein